jgi:hypothetical protein
MWAPHPPEDDCLECGAAGSVVSGVCQVCGADLDPPASRTGTIGPVAPMLHPSIPMRFVDVIDELRTIASMATQAGQVQGAAVAAACRRAESLLLVLRRQFLDEVTEVVRPASLQERRPSRPAMFTSRSPSGLGEFTSAG